MSSIHKVTFANGAYSEVYYYKKKTLKKNYANASMQDVIRLKVVQPLVGKEPVVDLFMTPGEAIYIISGLAGAVQQAVVDKMPLFHED